ncbi:MAG: hypothetical protein RJA13_1924 [Bacteroidota bacterium]|jgi:hypothetical protein
MFKRCTLSIVTAAVLSMLTFSAQAKPIKDSYIVVFKEPLDVKDRVVHPPKKEKVGKVKFMENTNDQDENTNDQDKDQLANDLKFKGKILHLLESMNAMYVNMTDEEAQKWERDERVAYISQSVEISDAATSNPQPTPGWALDRLDETTPILDTNFYMSGYDGKGSTIYIFDTGISDNPIVRNEFLKDDGITSRLTVWDVNDPVDPPLTIVINGVKTTVTGGVSTGGIDQRGHGTSVAVAAAGKTYGVARGANVISVRLTTSGTLYNTSGQSTITGGDVSSVDAAAFDWLVTNAAVHAQPGTIVNYSRGVRTDYEHDQTCADVEKQGANGTIVRDDRSTIDKALETAIQNAAAKGIIVVIAAHNDGCNTQYFSPANLSIDHAFVMGATSKNKLFPSIAEKKDETMDNGVQISRYGDNIAAYAPGQEVRTLSLFGDIVYPSGTSFATAYTSGMFATACQAIKGSPKNCTNSSVKELYEMMRNSTKSNTNATTVHKPDGTQVIQLKNGVSEPAIFLSKWW